MDGTIQFNSRALMKRAGYSKLSFMFMLTLQHCVSIFTILSLSSVLLTGEGNIKVCDV